MKSRCLKAIAFVAIVLISCKGGVSEYLGPPPDPKPIVSITAKDSVSANGVFVVLQWSGRFSSNCTASWSSGIPTSGSAVIAVQAGQYSYSISCEGAGGVDSATSTVLVKLPEIAVRLVLLDKGVTGACQGFKTSISWGAFADTAVVNLDCTAVVRTLLKMRDTVLIRVWGVEGDALRYFGARTTIRKKDLDTERKFVLPTLEFEGEQIDLEWAFEETVDYLPVLSFFLRHKVGPIWSYSLQTWPSESIPIPFAPDTAGTAGRFTPEQWESVKSAIAELANDDEFGKQYFRPATLGELFNNSGKLVRGVFVTPDTGISYAGLNGALDDRNINMASCIVKLNWNDVRNLTDPLGMKLARKAVKHEFVHCLGVGHERAPTGLMSAPSIGPSDPRFGKVTKKEAVHISFLYKMGELVRQTGARHWLPDVYEWFRVERLSLPENPYYWPFF